MPSRRTITMDDDVYKLVQKWRAEMILFAELNFNFTEAVNHLLRERLRNIQWKT